MLNGLVLKTNFPAAYINKNSKFVTLRYLSIVTRRSVLERSREFSPWPSNDDSETRAVACSGRSARLEAPCLPMCRP